MPDERSLAAGAALERRIRELAAAVYCRCSSCRAAARAWWSRCATASRSSDLRALNVAGSRRGLGHRDAQQRTRAGFRGSRPAASRAAGRARALALFISDVPGDDPGVIGSGLLGRDGGLETHRASRRRERRRGAATRCGCGAGPRPRARERAPRASMATRRGRAASSSTRCAPRAADGLVWGGESTVTLPAKHGRGGRNTHLALAAARLLRAGEPLTILAAGTDGTDGPTDDAGAIVDAGTVERAELAGCDVERAFREFDSGTALEAAGDLVHTGPDGHECRGSPDRHQTFRQVAAWPCAASHALIAPRCVCCSSTTIRVTARCCATTFRATGRTSISSATTRACAGR